MSDKRRRGNGEGSYVKLPSGKWQYRRSVMTPAGTYKIFSATANTQHEAREKTEKKIADFTRQASDMTLEEFSKLYIKDGCAEGYMKKSTLEKTVKPTFKNRINPALGDKKLVELKRADIQQWVTKLAHSNCLRRNQRLSKKGVESILGVLKASLTWAVDMEYLDRNPAQRIRVPDLTTEEEAETKKYKQDEDFLSKEEIRQLVEEIQIPNKYPTKNVIMFLLLTGCRLGESLGLTWKCVGKDKIQIRKTLEKIPGEEPYLDKTKTSMTRDIEMTENIAPIIREQRLLQMNYRTLSKGEWTSDLHLVFTQIDGKPFTSKMVYGQLKKAGKTIGLKNSKGEERTLHPHTLRHTFVTLALDTGTMSDIEASRYIGHKSLKTTEKYYIKDSAWRKKEAEGMDKVFSEIINSDEHAEQPDAWKKHGT